RTMRVPGELCLRIVIKGTPLLLNETMWAAAVAFLNQCYSVRGLDVVAGLNIANTINNVFMIVFMALGNSVGIMVGQLLGAGRMREARETDTRLIAFSVFASVITGLLMLVTAPLFPRLYNTTESVRSLAMQFIVVQAVWMPNHAFLHASYFTLRSGGKTLVTFLFDSVFIWTVSVTLAYTLSRFTDLSVISIFMAVTAADLIKSVVGFILVKKGVWIQNIVEA
ncbi:MAG: MATE family efflux transporter, partial [Lachnospiraceae bacterium]|nr:MATE family efflux transporter [Lachnospiraceae bacterium]